MQMQREENLWLGCVTPKHANVMKHLVRMDRSLPQKRKNNSAETLIYLEIILD